jgi:hypothetical protein
MPDLHSILSLAWARHLPIQMIDICSAYGSRVSSAQVCQGITRQSEDSMNKRRMLVLGLAVVVVGVLVFAVGSPIARRRTESRLCAGNLVSIGHALKKWAKEHDGVGPSDLASMSEQVPWPRFVHCPCDAGWKDGNNIDWAKFNPSGSSYQLVSPGAKDGDANAVVLKCRVHGHVLYADGSVFAGETRYTESAWGGSDAD